MLAFGQIGRFEDVTKVTREGRRVAGRGKVFEGMVAPALVEFADQRPLHAIGGIEQPVGVGGRAARADVAPDQEQADDDAVDQRDCRLVEVVVVLGDELAELVDEGAESDPGDEGCDRFPYPMRVDDQHAEADHHAQPAPEHVRDVQGIAPDLGITGQGEVGADHENAHHCRDQPDLDQCIGVRIADPERIAFDSVLGIGCGQTDSPAKIADALGMIPA